MAERYQSIKSSSPIPRSALELLSPEIRNIIYEQLVVSPRPISIRCARKKSDPLNEPTSNFGCIIRLNKMFYQEASALFYAGNTFKVGNGDRGSTTQPNLMALKQFIKRVPADHISAITKIIIEVRTIKVLRGYPINLETHQGDFCTLPKANDLADLQTIAKTVARHFKVSKPFSFA